MNKFPSAPVETYEELCAACDEIGCELKTFDEMSSWAHYSPGVARGGRFTPFSCSCCGYSPTESVWRADLAKHRAKTKEEQDVARARHRDADDELNSHKQHYHQELFMPPMVHHGMERCGVDGLHLFKLNTFKHLFRYTIHAPLPKSKKKLVAEYLHHAGFYSYDAASEDEDPTAHWIGREVTRFLAEADKHLPFLLRVAAAPVDCVPATASWRNAAGQQTLDDDSDDEYAVTEEEVAAEMEEEKLMMLNADRWDHFLSFMIIDQKLWPQGEPDTDEYRKGRAVEAFNAFSYVSNDLLQLNPELATWVPHIGQYIYPRQLVELGDAARRSAESCESFGAKMKKTIKHLTCRRNISRTATPHTSKAGKSKWKQIFTKGYIEQAFSRACVSESLKHGEDNLPYLQARDARTKAAGKANAYKKFSEETPSAMRSMRELTQELEQKEQGAGGS